MTKRRKQIISVILSIAMIVMMLPVISYGQETNTEIVEIISKRDQNSKTYQNTDGTYTKIITAEALHFEDNLGVWQEIDNRLENVDGVLQNIANSFTAKLPEMMNSETEVVLSKESNSIKIKTVGAIGSSLGNVLNNEEPKEKQQQIDYTNLWKTSSEVYYSDVYDSADIQYIVQPMGLKENIIIKNAPENQIWYEYEITAEGLVGEKKEDGSIEFYKNGNVEYVIPAPYMFDSSGKPEGESFDIDVEFIEVFDGKYRLTYTPSIEWLQDIEREYPVTLDPTIITTQNTTVIDDAYVRQETPNANYGMNSMLYANTNTFQNETYTHETYVKFNTSLDFTGVVLHADLKLHFSGTATSYNAYMVTGSWTETGLTWNNKPSYNTSIVCVSNTPTNGDYTTFDITDIVEQWCHYGVTNNGIRIKGAGGLTTHPTNSKFRSSEYGVNHSFTSPFMQIFYSSSAALNVTRFTQQYTHWCWAACIQMILDYEGINISVPSGSSTQEEICKQFIGVVNPLAEANDYDIINLLQHYSSSMFNDATTNTLLANNIYKIYKSIANNKPVILKVKKYNKETYHFLLIYAFDMENQMLYFIDPYNSGSGYSSATEYQLFNGFTTPGISTSCTGVTFIIY